MGGDLSERQESPLEIMDPGVGGVGVSLVPFSTLPPYSPSST